MSSESDLLLAQRQQAETPAPPVIDESTLPARTRAMASSQIAEIADLAREDPTVIKLWIGEGDLPTPDFVSEAAMTALRDGHTRYTYSRGLPRLHEALSAYYRRHWGVEVPASRFSITAGGMNAIMQCFQAILEPGDEVIYHAPAWANMIEAAKISGGVPVSVPFRRDERGGFVLPVEDILGAVTPRTKAIIVNSPSNPTGWIMPRGDMDKLAAFARERGIWIIADEVYSHFTYGNAIAPSFLQVCQPNDRLIVTNTFSKNWAMTGWRAGWLVFPEMMQGYFARIGQYSTTSIPTFIQHAAIEALEKGDDFIRTMVARCAQSRAIFMEGLGGIPGLRLRAPEGAFYLFFSVDGETDSRALARRVLYEAKVGLAPGTAFGPEGVGCLRLCFAISPELARDAVARLQGFFRAAAPR